MINISGQEAYPHGDRKDVEFNTAHFGEGQLNIRKTLMKLPVDTLLVLIRPPVAQNTRLKFRKKNRQIIDRWIFI